MSQVLIENLGAVRYPIEDTQEILVLLSKLELQADMLLQESAQADTAIEEAEEILKTTKAKQEQLLNELDHQRKRQEDLKELSDFAESLKLPKTVSVNGREVIADLHQTRSQELALIEKLQGEYESLSKEETELSELWTRRYEAFSALSNQMEDWAVEYGFLRAEYRNSNKNNNTDQVAEDTTEKEPQDAPTEPEIDVEMEIE